MHDAACTNVDIGDAQAGFGRAAYPYQPGWALEKLLVTQSSGLGDGLEEVLELFRHGYRGIWHLQTRSRSA